MQPFYLALGFILGALVGSFLNVVILRLPKGQGLGGRSHCPHCGRTLSPRELVPVLSFVFLGGRCRNCKANISVRYAAIEAVTGLLFALALAFFHPGAVGEWLVTVKAWLVLAVLVVVFVIDWEHFLILDSVLLVGSVGVLLLNICLDLASQTAPYGWHGMTLPALLMGALCPLPFFLIWYFSAGRWMGFGDVKLAVFLGLALGWPLAWVGMFLGICLGGVTGIGLLASGKKQLKSRVAFGTFLSVGAAIAMFYGMPVLEWYLSLIGLRP